MSNLIVIAKVKALPGKSEAVKAALQKIVNPTLKEDGCIQYDLHQDAADQHQFYFYEIWESGAHLKVHGSSPHILAMREITKDIVESSELKMMNKI